MKAEQLEILVFLKFKKNLKIGILKLLSIRVVQGKDFIQHHPTIFIVIPMAQI